MLRQIDSKNLVSQLIAVGHLVFLEDQYCIREVVEQLCERVFILDGLNLRHKELSEDAPYEVGLGKHPRPPEQQMHYSPAI